MGTLSIGKAWEEAVAFVGREGKLLFPVAFLFVALPSLIFQEMTPPELTVWMATTPPRPPFPHLSPAFWLAGLLTILIIWFGSLTLFALALRPGISVGEALRLGLVRLPILVGTGLLVVAGVAVAAVLVVLLGALLSLQGGGSAAVAGVIALLLGAAMLFVGVRFVLLNPVVIDGTEGVIASLKHSWMLTRGHFWRLFGFLFILTILSMIVAVAAQAVFGSIAGLIGGAGAAEFVGGIAAAAVSTVVQVYMLVMLARLYRQAEAG